MLGNECGGTPARMTTPFIDWASLRNPILAIEEDPRAGTAARALKDVAVVYEAGAFYLFSSTRVTAATKPLRPARPFFRTRDFKTYEEFSIIGVNTAGTHHGSPNITRIADHWYLVFQASPAPPAPCGPAHRQLFFTTTTTLADPLSWAPVRPLAPALAPDHSLIDGALASTGEQVFLGFKWRQQQTFHVAHGTLPAVAGEAPIWVHAPLVTIRARAGTALPYFGFAENYQFINIDGIWRLLATGRDPALLRGGLANLRYAKYTCSHEPFLYTMQGDGTQPAHWRQWRRKTHLRIPEEAWNPVMHANAAFLADWRTYDGFFYLFYAGAADGDQFDLRGHGKIGVARSRDLVHWRVPGDLRDVPSGGG